MFREYFTINLTTPQRKEGRKMKIYKTEAELMKDVVNGSLVIEDSITLKFNMTIRINITAWDITAWDITARNINAGDINAWDITAWDITAGDITARNINAGDINAWDINAWNILYYAFCCVYNSILCLSIKAKREKHQKPICLDGKLKLKKASQ
jgi:hypothetical protein